MRNDQRLKKVPRACVRNVSEHFAEVLGPNSRLHDIVVQFSTRDPTIIIFINLTEESATRIPLGTVALLHSACISSQACLVRDAHKSMSDLNAMSSV